MHSILSPDVLGSDSSSNLHSVYLGLKTGWTFGASLFGSIFGFAILKPLSKALPVRFGGGYFGPKENVCCQSAATVSVSKVVVFDFTDFIQAAGSLGLLFTSGFPAAYQLGLLGDDPVSDFGFVSSPLLSCMHSTH